MSNTRRQIQRGEPKTSPGSSIFTLRMRILESARITHTLTGPQASASAKSMQIDVLFSRSSIVSYPSLSLFLCPPSKGVIILLRSPNLHVHLWTTWSLSHGKRSHTRPVRVTVVRRRQTAVRAVKGIVGDVCRQPAKRRQRRQRNDTILTADSTKNQFPPKRAQIPCLPTP